MHTVSQLLQTKGHTVETVERDSTVYDALAIMAEKGIGALVVMHAGKPVGLISERDYARSVILKGRSSKETKVGQIMSTHVVVAHPDQNVEECMAIMTEKRVRHLPVMQGDELIGIISIGDLVKAIIETQQFMIEQLVSYINQ